MSDKIRKVYVELDRLMAVSGTGVIKRTLSAAGVSPSYLRDLRGRLAAGQEKGYDLGVLLRILEALGVDHRFFFGRVFGSVEAVELCRLEVRRLGDPPEVVGKVRDLLLEEGWSPPPEVPRLIRDLDAHRYQDANEVRVIAQAQALS